MSFIIDDEVVLIFNISINREEFIIFVMLNQDNNSSCVLYCLEFIALVEPHFSCCIAGHSPIATGTKANATHFGAIGQARTLELLGEETAEENP